MNGWKPQANTNITNPVVDAAEQAAKKFKVSGGFKNLNELMKPEPQQGPPTPISSTMSDAAAGGQMRNKFPVMSSVMNPASSPVPNSLGSKVFDANKSIKEITDINKSISEYLAAATDLLR